MSPRVPLHRRLLPHPVLTLVLTLVWVLLFNQFTMGVLVLGLILGILIPFFTRSYWPDKPRLRNPVAMLGYAGVVLWDILIANIQVAYLILFKRNEELTPRFVVIPLDITSPEAITTLAGTITLTPGTVSSDLSDDGRSLLVHCLDAPDGEAVVSQIKRRYEARLKEIFE